MGWLDITLPTPDELRSCSACPLQGHGNPVPGEAWSSCDVMLVGEGPGATEASTGRPFVGESGRRLRGMLEEADVTSFYLTNTVKHRTDSKNRSPTAEEVAGCLPFLRREVAVIAPKVIVLIGVEAMVLAGFKARGRVKKTHGRWGSLWGVPCVAMIHPAAIGRMNQKDRGAWTGSSLAVLRQARRKTEGWELTPVGHQQSGGAWVPSGAAFDLETTSTEPRDTEIVLGAATSAQDGVTRVYPAKWFADYGHLAFEPPDPYLIMHHSAFDATVAARYGLDLRHVRLDDSMVLAHVKGIEDLSLAGMSAKLLDEPVLSYQAMFGDRTPTYEEFADKCARDTVQTGKVWNHLAGEGGPDFRVYADIERPLLPIVAQMQHTGGFELAREELEAELASHEQRMAELETAFKGFIGDPDININSGAQVAKALSEALGLPLSRLTPKKDRASVDEAALRPLVPHSTAVAVLLSYRSLRKEASSFISPWLEVDRLTSLWHQTGARTGRWSSSKPNLQNIPGPLRRFLLAREGNLLVSADYSQVEYRVAAHLSQDPLMLEGFRNGEDFHDATQKRFGMPDRRMAKVFNFGGVLFGGSAAKMLEEATKWGLPLTWGEASEFLKEAHRIYPTYYRWADAVAKKGMIDGTADGLFGRTFRLAEGMNASERNKLGRQAVNYPTQGGAMDIVKLAMGRAWYTLGRPINAQVHDEIVFEVAEEEANEFAETLRPVLLAENPLSIPIDVEIRVSRRWKE